MKKITKLLLVAAATLAMALSFTSCEAFLGMMASPVDAIQIFSDGTFSVKISNYEMDALKDPTVKTISVKGNEWDTQIKKIVTKASLVEMEVNGLPVEGGKEYSNNMYTKTAVDESSGLLILYGTCSYRLVPDSSTKPTKYTIYQIYTKDR